MASVRSLDNAYGYTGYGAGDALIPQQGRLMRNLIEGGDLVMSHILHFYHLAALDYISTGYADCPISGVAPWAPKDNTADMVGDPGGALSGLTGLANTLIGNYVQALNIRRQAHQMIALASGKQPCQPTFTPGGVTNVVTNAMTADFSSLLTVINNFVDNTYLPDVSTVAGAFSGALLWLGSNAASGAGHGCMKYLAYGTFPNSAGTNQLTGGFLDLTAGWPGTLTAFDQNNIQEHITYSFYDNGGGAYDKLHPSRGVTSPKAGKAGAYSWLKAPRYATGTGSANTHVCEVGPLARVLVNVAAGNAGVLNALLNWKAATPALSALGTATTLDAMRSVLGRHAARAVECQVVAHAMTGWLAELGGPTTTSGQTYKWRRTPKQSTGYGLTEAPRGALGHWVGIKGKKISHYQCVVPTTWNGCPKDDYGQPGPIEQALSGANVTNDATGRTRVGRIVRSFDPCIACAVHIVSPDKEKVTKFELPTL
jgi:hydrogenase large subunit